MKDKMKKITILFLGLLVVMEGMAQGIQFENVSWAEVLVKAKKEKKLIFMDCYTSWCGPCKHLAAEVFTQQAVGEYFNRHFVNVKYDMESEEGRVLAEKYGVKAFPTLLYINALGEVVHRTVGGMPDKVLLEQAEMAMNPERNFVGLQRRYQEGERNSEFLKSYADALHKAFLLDEKSQVMEEYLSSLPMKELLTKEMWPLLRENVKDPISTVFQRLVFGHNELRQVVGREVDNYIYTVLKKRISEMNATVLLDSAYYAEFVQFLQRTSYEEASSFLVQLYAMKCGKEGDYEGVVQVLHDMYRYNLVRSTERAEYIGIYLNYLQKCPDAELVADMCEWVAGLEKGLRDPIQLVALKDVRYNLLMSHGNREEAASVKKETDELVKGFEERYKRPMSRIVVSF